jgi:hypothetical protein
MLRKMLVCVALLAFPMVCATGCGSDDSKNPKVEKAGGALKQVEDAGKKSGAKVSE